MVSRRKLETFSNPWLETEPESRGKARRRRWARAASALCAVVIGVAGIETVATYSEYATPVWWAAPSRIHWCGRDYASSAPSISRAEISPAGLIGQKAYPLREIGRLPPVFGRAIVAPVTPERTRHSVTPPLPCAMEIYLDDLHGGYVPYVIEGGP